MVEWDARSQRRVPEVPIVHGYLWQNKRQTVYAD